MRGFDQKNRECIVVGYLRNNIRIQIPIEITQIILMFYYHYILFNVYKKNGKNIIHKCKHISIHKDGYFFINNDNILYCYGKNSSGQLGLGSNTFETDIIMKHNFNGFHNNIGLMSQSICGSHVFVYTLDNILYGFGYNGFAQLGFKSYTYPFTVKIPTKNNYNFDSKLISIKCGQSHTLFLSSNGNVYGSGWNYYLQLSNKSTIDNNVDCIIDSNNVISIDCGANSSYILQNDNKLCSFGHNRYGQLGINRPDINKSGDINSILNDIKIRYISAGTSHVGCISMDNKLYMFGRNHNSQCGLDNVIVKNCHSINQIILPNEVITDISCGLNRNIIKTESNNYYGFGSIDKGLLIQSESNTEIISIPALISHEHIYKLTKSRNKIMDIIPTCFGTIILQQS